MPPRSGIEEDPTTITDIFILNLPAGTCHGFIFLPVRNLPSYFRVSEILLYSSLTNPTAPVFPCLIFRFLIINTTTQVQIQLPRFTSLMITYKYKSPLPFKLRNATSRTMERIPFDGACKSGRRVSTLDALFIFCSPSVPWVADCANHAYQRDTRPVSLRYRVLFILCSSSIKQFECDVTIPRTTAPTTSHDNKQQTTNSPPPNSQISPNATNSTVNSPFQSKHT